MEAGGERASEGCREGRTVGMWGRGGGELVYVGGEGGKERREGGRGICRGWGEGEGEGEEDLLGGGKEVGGEREEEGGRGKAGEVGGEAHTHGGPPAHLRQTSDRRSCQVRLPRAPPTPQRHLPALFPVPPTAAAERRCPRLQRATGGSPTSPWRRQTVVWPLLGPSISACRRRRRQRRIPPTAERCHRMPAGRTQAAIRTFTGGGSDRLDCGAIAAGASLSSHSSVRLASAEADAMMCLGDQDSGPPSFPSLRCRLH